MADLTTTPANVKLEGTTSNTFIELMQLGEALVASDLVYKHTDQKLWKADNSTAAKANIYGIMLMGGAADDVGIVLKKGPVNPGGTLVAGNAYEVSANAGKIADSGDAASADFLTPIGVATATDTLQFNPQPTGLALP